MAAPTAEVSAKEAALKVAAMVAGSSSLITLIVISSVVVLVPSETSNVMTRVEFVSKSKSPVRVTSPVSDTVMSSLPLPLREYVRALPSGSVALKVATTVPAGTVSDTLTWLAISSPLMAASLTVLTGSTASTTASSTSATSSAKASSCVSPLSLVNVTVNSTLSCDS